jgi:hypothetical protein
MARTRKAGRWTKVNGWRGGRAWRDPDGRLTFYIRRQVRGVSYDVNTGCSSIAAAAAHLERFERDPEGYRAATVSAEPIFLDEKRVEAFLAWSLGEKGNSSPWVAKQKSHLAWWADKLAGVDLRRASLRDHIVPAYQGATDSASRVRVLKAFYGWLRKVTHAITAAEDPTLGVLSVPVAKPAQRTKSKVIPREHYLLVRDHLRAEEETRWAAREERKRAAKVVSISTGETVEEEGFGPWADALVVLAGTGWHTTEIVRFAASGTIEPLPKSMKVDNGAVGVLVCPLHKSGDTHRTAVSQEVIDAATRLLTHGAFSREWFDRAVRSACKAVKLPVPRPDGTDSIPVFTPGRFRHSVATWAFEAGADPFAVSAFLGHKSPATTRKFYATLATVPKVPTLA